MKWLWQLLAAPVRCSFCVRRAERTGRPYKEVHRQLICPIMALTASPEAQPTRPCSPTWQLSAGQRQVGLHTSPNGITNSVGSPGDSHPTDRRELAMADLLGLVAVIVAIAGVPLALASAQASVRPLLVVRRHGAEPGLDQEALRPLPPLQERRAGARRRGPRPSRAAQGGTQMRPDGAHVHGGGHGAELAGALAVIAAAGAAVAFIAEFIWAVLAVVVVLAAAAVYAGRRMYLKYGRAPEVLPWQQRAALPARQATPIAARPVQALPAPQVQIFNFYGVTPGQAAEVVEQQRRAIDEG